MNLLIQCRVYHCRRLDLPGTVKSEKTMRRFLFLALFALAVILAVRPGAAQKPEAQKAEEPDPRLTLWLNVKRQLLAPNGKQWFDANLRNVLLPGKSEDGPRGLKGTVLESRPAKRPTELVLALSDDHTPEVTITLRNAREDLVPLLKPLPVGSEIEFQGLGVSFTQNPFMVVFEVQVTSGPAGANPTILKRAGPAGKGGKP
jgi:hypothetical protein